MQFQVSSRWTRTMINVSDSFLDDVTNNWRRRCTENRDQMGLWAGWWRGM